VTTLLFLEKQLNDLASLIGKMPTLDPAETWHFDEGQDAWASAVLETHRTKKVPQAFIKAPATDKHPAQVEVILTDEVVGYWSDGEVLRRAARDTGPDPAGAGRPAAGRGEVRPRARPTPSRSRTPAWPVPFWVTSSPNEAVGSPLDADSAAESTSTPPAPSTVQVRSLAGARRAPVAQQAEALGATRMNLSSKTQHTACRRDQSEVAGLVRFQVRSLVGPPRGPIAQ
jgi:hypothetical protein